MVLILEGNSKIDVHVSSKNGDLICHYWFSSTAVAYLQLITYNLPVFHHTCATCAGLPSNISTRFCTNEAQCAMYKQQKIQFQSYLYPYNYDISTAAQYRLYQLIIIYQVYLMLSEVQKAYAYKFTSSQLRYCPWLLHNMGLCLK